MVSVSRRAGLPHFGHGVDTKAAERASGFPSRPVNSTSYGSVTGRALSGTGTTPQRSQVTTGTSPNSAGAKSASRAR
jgi:hypothetical protein